MTRKVFWEDPYLTTHETTVTSVQGPEVTVQSTIFYAFSGGQESDAGTIAGLPVRSARKEGQEIIYTLDDGHGLRAGQAVAMTIQWPRRLRLMRLHFAAELVLKLAGRAMPGAEKVGAHIAESKARIDFLWPENLAPLLPGIKAAVQALIDADPAITSAFEDEPAERRTWEIPGFARVPCGGTHPRRAGEVGRIALKRNNIGGGKERIEITLEAEPGSLAGPVASALALALALGLGACRSPQPASGRPAPARPGQAPAAAAKQPQGPAHPQFTFASWSRAKGLIREGKVIQTVSSQGGFALILQDYTWVRLVAQPGDPIPANPLDYVIRNAPNAKNIRHSTE